MLNFGKVFSHNKSLVNNPVNATVKIAEGEDAEKEQAEMRMIQFIQLPMLLTPKQTVYYVVSLLAGLLARFISGAFPSRRRRDSGIDAGNFWRNLQQRVLLRNYTGFPIKHPGNLPGRTKN
ncbi:MAG: hypothetical protein NVSMB63_11560 [Sediminibacterium sp.]